MKTEIKEFIQDVIDSWNSHDLERILSHYSDDFELTSPVIKRVLEINDGTIRKKENVRIWWRRVLNKVPDIKFELIDISESVDSIVMIQKSLYENKITVSNFYFNEEGKIRKEVYFN